MNKIPPKLTALLKEFEGLGLKAYRCPAGVLTIGYGHTGPDVTPAMTITAARAEELLAADCLKCYAQVTAIFNGTDLNANQLAALVSFVFNLGASRLATSTLAKKIKANPADPAIRAEFLRWTFAGGKPLPGLKRRRQAEANLYFSAL